MGAVLLGRLEGPRLQESRRHQAGPIREKSADGNNRRLHPSFSRYRPSFSGSGWYDDRRIGCGGLWILGNTPLAHTKEKSRWGYAEVDVAESRILNRGRNSHIPHFILADSRASYRIRNLRGGRTDGWRKEQRTSSLMTKSLAGNRTRTNQSMKTRVILHA